jgi:small-conductance mechanosensitive channel
MQDFSDIIELYVVFLVLIFFLFNGYYTPWQALALTFVVTFISVMILFAIEIFVKSIDFHEEIEKWNRSFAKKFSDLR